MDGNEEARPYKLLLDHMSDKSRLFSKFSGDFDLTLVHADEDIFGGALATIAEEAKGILCGLDRHDIHAVLTVADSFVWGAVRNIELGGGDGSSFVEVIERERASVADLAPLVARSMVEESLLLADDVCGREVKIAPEIFFAAASLSELHSALRHDDTDWWLINGGYHAIQSARLLALATTLAPRASMTPVLGHMALVVEKVKARDRAKKGGDAKAANARPNPEKERALECARQHPGLSALQIKTRAKLRASERTVRGWISAACK